MELSLSEEKQVIREKIWRKMKKENIERFPYAWGRVPHFKGAEKAASILGQLKEFKTSKTVFVAPDSPQRPVRELVLVRKKVLIMPTPRLRSGFLLVCSPKGKEREVSSIKGAFTYGTPVSVEDMPVVDVVVQGAVAVDFLGGRLGKGGGYGDREIAYLREHGKIPRARIVVTVHDVQVVSFLPQNLWDFTVDIIVTPTKTIRTCTRKREAVSKYMSYFLRHNPPETMSEDGFVLLEDLLRLVQKRYNVDKEYIMSTVEKDPKGRFQIHNDRIRALYGHSAPVRVELLSADIDILYHGTTEHAAQQILKEGLQPKGRRKVHLSPTPEMAVEVGRRKCDRPVILRIDARKASEVITIEKASNAVYVANFIPPEYISIE